MSELDLAKSVANGELDLLCPKMEVRRFLYEHEVLMSGAGQIRINKRGELSFKLSAGGPPLPMPDVLRGDKPQGTLYAPEDHAFIVAVDAQGREWRSDPLLIHMKDVGEIVHGFLNRPLSSVVCRSECLKQAESRLFAYVPRQRELPFNQKTKLERTASGELVSGRWSLDHHVRGIGEAKVTFRKEDDSWLTISAEQPSHIAAEWAGLMCHALSFATVGLARPAVIVRYFDDCKETQLLSGPFRQYDPIMPRPVIGLLPEHAEPFWSLVEKLFLFCTKRSDEQLSFLKELEALRVGAIMPLHTAGLTLAIAIESLAKSSLPATPSDPWNADAKRALEKHISSWTGDAGTKSRVLAWLKSTGQVRAVDQLYVWANRQGVKHDLVNQWSALRNRRAHGAELANDQPTYDRYYAVVELYYRLIASVIGYDGEILESSIPGWGHD